MPLCWNEIKSRAMKFSRDWADEASEEAEAKSFWDAFFGVFGITRKRVANSEKRGVVLNLCIRISGRRLPHLSGDTMSTKQTPELEALITKVLA